MVARAEPAPSTIGAVLRRRREALGLTLADAAAQLRIRAAFLAAIEAGRFAELPGDAYAVGFVRAYADLLGLDGEATLAQYRGELALAEKPSLLAWPQRRSDNKPFPGLLVLAVSLLLAGLLYLGYHEVAPPMPQQADEAAVPAVPESLKQAAVTPIVPAPAPTEPPPPAPPAPAAAPEPPAPPPPEQAAAQPEPAPDAAPPPAPEAAPEPAAPPSPPSLVLRARLDSWIEIRSASGDLVVQKILRAGESYEPPPESAGWILDTGNAGGLIIEIDGQALPELGAVGIIRRGIPLDPVRLMQLMPSGN